MRRLFGTDGIREVANSGLDPYLAMLAGRAGAAVLGGRDGHKKRFAVGRDTRISGPLLASAVTAGICSTGADVIDLGIIPTPAIAYLTRSLEVDGGVVVSASHNPAEYNGIKFFNSSGFKLPDSVEEEIEGCMLDGDGEPLRWGRVPGPTPTGGQVGRVWSDEQASETYIQHVVSTCRTRLDGLKVVVDCANGASYQTAPEVYRRLGADVKPLYCEPDGTNINVECGSTHIHALQRAVVESGADLGLAHDGDADRVIAVDHRGRVVDGDQIMVVCGFHLMNQHKLKADTIVATSYSNLGLVKAFEERDGRVIIADAGDRHVVETMIQQGLNLGGEQSGHIVFLDHATTGDGLITAVQLMAVLKETGEPLCDLASVMVRYPQFMMNVKVRSKLELSTNRAIAEAIEGAQRLLGEEGRVLVRPSGTEPLVRVMGEARDAMLARHVVELVATVVRDELGCRE